MLRFQQIKKKLSREIRLSCRKNIELVQEINYNHTTSRTTVFYTVRHTVELEPGSKTEKKTYYVGIFLVQALETFNQLTK